MRLGRVFGGLGTSWGRHGASWRLLGESGSCFGSDITSIVDFWMILNWFGERFVWIYEVKTMSSCTSIWM